MDAYFYGKAKGFKVWLADGFPFRIAERASGISVARLSSSELAAEYTILLNLHARGELQPSRPDQLLELRLNLGSRDWPAELWEPRVPSDVKIALFASVELAGLVLGLVQAKYEREEEERRLADPGEAEEHAKAMRAIDEEAIREAEWEDDACSETG